MTQSGELLTLKGEFKEPESVFSFHQSVAMSYGVGIENRNSVELEMFPPGQPPLPFFQMIFVLKGRVAFVMKDLKGNYVRIESQQHNLCFIKPGSTRMVLNDPKDDVICINLSKAFLDRYLPDNHPARAQFNSKLGIKMPPVLSKLNMRITPEISAILQRLDQTTHSGFCGQLLLESRVIELLALQISQFESTQLEEKPLCLKKEELDKMLGAREIIISHTGEQLSLRALAHLVGTNEFNLKRNFKIAFGSTVYGYLSQYKMEKAKAMLIEKDLTVAEVSLKMGYKYATHFSTAFKKYFGYLPNRLRSGKLSIFLFMEEISVAFEEVALLLGHG
ncbi:MAG: AraC family transcriptional regulator [Bacteroidota bacterium]